MGAGQRARDGQNRAAGRHARGRRGAQPHPAEEKDRAHRPKAGGAHRRAARPRLRRAVFAGRPANRQGRAGGAAAVYGYAALAAPAGVFLRASARRAHAQPAQCAAQGHREKPVAAADAGHVGRAARARGCGDLRKPARGRGQARRACARGAPVADRRARGAAAALRFAGRGRAGRLRSAFGAAFAGAERGSSADDDDRGHSPGRYRHHHRR